MELEYIIKVTVTPGRYVGFSTEDIIKQVTYAITSSLEYSSYLYLPGSRSTPKEEKLNVDFTVIQRIDNNV